MKAPTKKSLIEMVKQLQEVTEKLKTEQLRADNMRMIEKRRERTERVECRQ
jgi:hypothetical protein